MVVLNWLTQLRDHSHSKVRKTGRSHSRQIEPLERRLVLSAAATEPLQGVGQHMNWFAAASSVEPTGSDEGIGGLRDDFASPPLGESYYIVRLTPAASQRLESIDAAQSYFLSSEPVIEVVRGLGLSGQLLVRSLSSDAAHVEVELRANPNVASFEADLSVGSQETQFPNERDVSPDFVRQYGLHNTGQDGGVADADIDAPEAWFETTGSTKVVVSVIDSGVDYTHPDLYLNIWINNAEIPAALRGRIVETEAGADDRITFRDLNAGANRTLVTDFNANGYIDAADLLADPLWTDGIDTDNNGFEDDLVGWDFRDNDNMPFDEHRHGTHVAGIIGASGNNGVGVVGVNWAVSILPLRFLDQNNSGELSDAIQAINYQTMLRTRTVEPANIRVSNNSWGTSNSLSQNLFDAVSATAAADILFVAAAGNGDVLGRGINNDAQPFFPANLDVANVISVAAIGADGRLANFSNFGSQTVDIAAPGVGIVSTELGGGYGTRNGTSMAAPFVSGVAALVFSQHPNATFQEVRDAVLTGADRPLSPTVPHALRGRVTDARSLNAHGAVTAATFAPQPELQPVSTISTGGGNNVNLQVRYVDDGEVDVSSFDIRDLVVTRRNFSRVRLGPTSVSTTTINSASGATYVVNAPGGTWDATDNGIYEVRLQDGEIRDEQNQFSAARLLGTFEVSISSPNVYFVNSTLDLPDVSSSDNVPVDKTGRITLRAAVMHARQSPETPQTIVIPDGTYVLSLSGAAEDESFTGDLDLFGNVTLIGGGALTTTIDAQGLDRVFDVVPVVAGSQASVVSISHLGITNGREAGTPSATENSAGKGGGLRNRESLLTLDAVLVSRNTAKVAGGGIYSNGELTVLNSSIEANQTTDRLTPFGGGGVASEFIGTIENSSITGNVTAAGFFFTGGGGGGVLNTATLTIRNSTISGNTATLGSGGGVLTLDGSVLELDHVTIVDNHADANTGGGLEVRNFTMIPAIARIRDSVIAKNTAKTSNDVFGAVESRGHNVFGEPSTVDPNDFRTVPEGETDFDLVGSVAQPIDPLLSELTKVDGLRSVHVPLPGSPLIDNGSTRAESPVDQLGTPRVEGDGVSAGNIQRIDTTGFFSLGTGVTFAGNYYFDGLSGFTPALLRFNQTTRVVEAAATLTSLPYDFEVLNDQLYFFINDSGNVRQLWSYSGTGSPQLRATFTVSNFSVRPGHLTAFNNKLYFRSEDATVGSEPFVFDPTTGIVSLVADLNLGSASSFPRDFTVLESALYFVANDSLMRLTSTVETPARVLENEDLSSLRNLTALDGQLVFSANFATSISFLEDRTLFIYVPQENYFYSIAQSADEAFSVPETDSFAIADGKLFFPATLHSESVGEELYFFDPKGATFIQRAADITQGLIGSDIRHLTSDGERVYFSDFVLQGQSTGGTGIAEEIYVYDPQTGRARPIRGTTENEAIVISGNEAFFLGTNRASSSSAAISGLYSFALSGPATSDIGAFEVGRGRVSGITFHDANGNGRHDPSEPGLAGQVLFDDANLNGRRDLNEPQVVSRTDDPATSDDETGQFLFESATPGLHRIRQIPSEGLVATAPRRFPIAPITLNSVATAPASLMGGEDRLAAPSVVGDQIVYLDRMTQSLKALIGGGDLRELINESTLFPGTSLTVQSIGTAPAQDGNQIAVAVELSDGSQAVLTVDRQYQLRVIADSTTFVDGLGALTAFGVDDAVRDSLGISNGIVGFYAESGSSAGFFASDGSTVVSIQPGDVEFTRYLQVGLDGARAVVILEFNFESGEVNQNFYLYDGLLRLRVGDSQRPVPGGTGVFTEAIDFSISGGPVAFRSLGAGGQDGIYVGSGIDQNRIVANTQTPIPGGTGNFTAFGPLTNNLTSPSVAIDGENVVFIGQGAGGQIGIYASINGVVRRIVDLTSDFTRFSASSPVDFDISHQAISGDTVVFHVNFADGSEAILSASLLDDPAADVVVQAGQTTDDMLFGARALPGSIRGVVFNDVDGDGVRDPSEAVPFGDFDGDGGTDVVVYLDTNLNGVLDDGDLDQASPDETGSYTFNNVPALATYVVRQQLRPTFVQTAPVDVAHATVQLGPAEIVELDFGSNRGGSGGQNADGSVSGRVFNDLDGDGRQDVGELGIGGIRVYIDENGDRVLNGGERSTMTLGDGSYVLNLLRGVNQAVRIVEPNSLTRQTSPLGNSFTRSTLPTADSPVEVVAFDADGDGDNDLAATLNEANEVQLFLNNGSGAFAAGQSLSVGIGPGSMAVGRFAGTGQRVGLVVGHRTSNNVVALVPQPGGGFSTVPIVSAAQTVPGQPLAALGNAPYVVTTGDLNGDGLDDIAIAAQNSLPSGGAIVTFLSNGMGGFTREQLLTLPLVDADSPTAITAVDVDGGGVDLLVANGLSNTVSVLHNTGVAGNSRFNITAHLPTGGTFPTSVRAGDLNGDSRADVVTANFASDNVSVFFGQLDGSFAAPLRLNSGRGPADVQLVDLDADQNLDIVFSTSDSQNRFGILRNRGAGLFQAAETSGLATLPDGTLAFTIAVGQFDADGLPDVAITNRRDPSQVNGTGSISLGRNAIVAGALNVELPAEGRSAAGLNFGLQSIDPLPTLEALPPSLRIAEDAPLQTISLRGLTAGFGQPLQTFRVSASSSNPSLFESLTVLHSGSSATGDVRYRAAANAFGEADITVSVTDSGLDDVFDSPDDRTFSRAVRLVVDPVDDVPPSSDDIAMTWAGAPAITVDLLLNELLANPDPGEDLRVFLVEPGSAGGTATLQMDRRHLRYTPRAGFSGTEFVRYYVTDGRHDPILATLTVTVQPVDLVINAGNDAIEVRAVGGFVELLRNTVRDASIGTLPASELVSLTITGGTGANTIDLRGVTSANFTRVGGVRVTVNGGGGNDTLFGSGFADDLQGGDGNDALTGGAGADTLNGGLGTDTLRESIDANLTLTATSLSAFAGAVTTLDALSFIELADIAGGTSANRIDVSGFTASGVTTLSGGGGRDTLIGSPGADVITALTGNDSISTGAGADTVFAGSGNDTVDGGDGNDSINGQNGDDQLSGGLGNDVLVGGAGLDTMNGDAGNDFISGQTEAGLLNGGDGNDTLQGNTANDTLNGNAGDDRLLGQNGDDVLNGGDGNDSVMGDAGADQLNGEAGADTLLGGLGNDTFDGGADFDQVREIADANFTVIGLNVSSSVLGNDTTINVERISLMGGLSNNMLNASQATVSVFLFGDGGDDTLKGGSRNDALFGGPGNDVLTGGAGNDLVMGDDGDDWFFERANSNFTVAALSVTSSATGTDALTTIEHIALIGGDGDNLLNASASSLPVVLLGGRGNDTLVGSNFNDVLIGGSRTATPATPGGDGVDSLDGGSGTDLYDNDPQDSRATLQAGETQSAIELLFAALPTWLDLI